MSYKSSKGYKYGEVGKVFTPEEAFHCIELMADFEGNDGRGRVRRQRLRYILDNIVQPKKSPTKLLVFDGRPRTLR
jgi:hypothetical protein